MYSCYWTGTGNKNRFSGVGMLIRCCKEIVVIEEPIYYGPRVMSGIISFHGYKMKLINVYSPTVDKSEDVKRLFYKKIDEAVSQKSINSQLVILGDFNATISALKYKSNLSHDNIMTITDLDYNDNGELVLDLIKDNKLYNLNTRFEHKLIRRHTRITPDKNKANQIIDLLNVNANLKQLCINCRVYNSFVSEDLSDHRLLVATFRIPVNKSMIKRIFNDKNHHKPITNPIKSLEKSALQNQDTRTKFIKNIMFEYDKEQSPAELNKKLIESLINAAIISLPEKVSNSKKIPWSNDCELLYLIEKKRKTNCRLEIKNLSKLIKKRIRLLENQFYQKECSKLNILRETREVEKEYKLAKDIACGQIFKDIRSNAIPIKDLVNHFKNHFNMEGDFPEMPEELKNPPPYLTEKRKIGNYENINQNPPQVEEIIANLKKLKDNKSAEDIPNEFIKYAQDHEGIINCLVIIFDKIWHGEEIPEDWGLCKIEALYKNKGKISDCTKYRGLSIGSSIAKLFCSIIINRLNSWYNLQLSVSQFGFRSGVGTVDAILKNKHIQRLASKTGRTIYALYIDLSAAFDKVIRSWIFHSIRIRIPEGANTILIDLLERFYRKTKAYLRLDENTIFNTSIGVRQGGIESPSLFCWYLDTVMMVYEARIAEKNIEPPVFQYRINNSATDRFQKAEFPGHGINKTIWTGYADDTTLYATSKTDLNECLNTISKVYEDYHLSLNDDKTETMIFNCKDQANYPESIIEFEGKKIQNSKSFRFLGSTIHFKEIGTENVELNIRIQNAKSKFVEYKRLLTNQHIKLETRMAYFNIFIRSRLTYACQTWHLAQSQFNKIDAAQRKLLRKMVVGGEKRKPQNNEGDEIDYRMKINTEKLLKICKCENISEFVKKQQIKYAAHIIREPNSSQTKQLLFNDNNNHKIGHKVPNLLDTAVRNMALSDLDHFSRESKKRRF